MTSSPVPPKTRTVLVTGGAGFIGSHLVDALVLRGDRVIVIDDLTNGTRDNLVASHGRFELLVSDVAAAGPALTAALAGGAVDVVYHLASLISSHDSLLNPRRYIDINVLGVLAALDLVRATRAPRFVLASSSTVYGTLQRDGCSESDVPAPSNVYAASKLMGEHLSAMYAARDGFTACSLRFFNVYGPRQSVRNAYANVVCHFLHAAARGDDITLYGDGSQARDFIYVDDVVEALLRAGEGACTGPVNVGTGEATSIATLLSRIEAVSGAPLTRVKRPAWPNDILHIRADVTRMHGVLGARARVSLDEGLARTLASIREKRT